MADDAGDVAVGVEVHRAGRAGVVDVLAGLDQLERLGPVAGADRLARGDDGRELLSVLRITAPAAA